MATEDKNIIQLRTFSETKPDPNNPKVVTKKNGTETSTNEKYTKPLTAEQMADFKTNYENPLRQEYMVDENGKFVEKDGNIANLFGFDPKEYEAQEAAKQKAAAFKRKEAGWANALKVVSDIATAAVGGNVYNTPMANVGKEAAQQEEASRQNVQRMGQAVAQAKRGQELGFAKARQEKLLQYMKQNGIQVNETTKTKGDDVTTTTGGGSVTDGYHEQQVSKNGNDSNNTYRISVNVTDTKTGKIKTQQFDADVKDIPTIKLKISNAYRNILKETKDGTRTKKSIELEDYLLNHGILKEKYRDGVEPDIDEDKMLQEGTYWNLPQDVKDMLQNIMNKDGGRKGFQERKEPPRFVKGQSNKVAVAANDSTIISSLH